MNIFEDLSPEFIKDQILQEIEFVEKNISAETEGDKKTINALNSFKEKIQKQIKTTSQENLIEIKRILENAKNLRKRKTRNSVIGAVKNIVSPNRNSFIKKNHENFKPAHCV